MGTSRPKHSEVTRHPLRLWSSTAKSLEASVEPGNSKNKKWYTLENSHFEPQTWRWMVQMMFLFNWLIFSFKISQLSRGFLQPFHSTGSGHGLQTSNILPDHPAVFVEAPNRVPKRLPRVAPPHWAQPEVYGKSSTFSKKNVGKFKICIK